MASVDAGKAIVKGLGIEDDTWIKIDNSLSSLGDSLSSSFKDFGQLYSQVPIFVQ